MIVHKGPHLKLEIELMIQEIKDTAYGEPLNFSMVQFINAKIQREIVEPFNESIGAYYKQDPITRCEYINDVSFYGSSVKLLVDISKEFARDLEKEDVSKSWPF